MLKIYTIRKCIIGGIHTEALDKIVSSIETMAYVQTAYVQILNMTYTGFMSIRQFPIRENYCLIVVNTRYGFNCYDVYGGIAIGNTLFRYETAPY